MGEKEIKRNVTTRIGMDFEKELNDIKDKRKELGKDKRKKLSTRIITDLIVKHKLWGETEEEKGIKQDLIDYDFEKGGYYE